MSSSIESKPQKSCEKKNKKQNLNSHQTISKKRNHLIRLIISFASFF